MPTAAVNTAFRFDTIIGNSDLAAMKRARESEAAALSGQAQAPVASLVSYILSVFEANKAAREASNGTDQSIDQQILQDYRDRESQYDDETLAKLKESGDPKLFIGIANTKCTAAEGWAMEVFDNGVEKSWAFDPTPVPDLGPATMQELAGRIEQDINAMAEQSGRMPSNQEIFDYAAAVKESMERSIREEAETRAGKMEMKVADQLFEGGFRDAFADFMTHLVTTKTAFLKGPIPRLAKRIQYSKTGKPLVKEVVEYQTEAPHPLDMYPSPDATSCQDGDLCERVRFRRGDLLPMIGTKNWDKDSIRAVVLQYGQTGITLTSQSDSQRLIVQNRSQPNPPRNGSWIEGIEFWGGVLGMTLMQRGITTDQNGKPLDPLNEYQINAIVIGTYCIYCRFNPDPLGRRPYYNSSWRKVPGQFWGKGVCAMMRDITKICNATIRDLAVNQSLSAGYQVVYNDVSRLDPGEDITNLYRNKVHQFTNPMPGNNTKPIEFMTMPNIAGQCLAVFKAFADMADEYTGIPSYAHGNDNVSGAGRTLGGLAMLQGNAARGFKLVICRIDREIMHPYLIAQFAINMMYDPDPSIKGDVLIRTAGALASIVKEQLVLRRMEYLNATNNPTDLAIMGLPGRATVHRETLKALDVPVGEVVPSAAGMRKLEEQRVALQRQAQMEQQMEMSAGQPAA